MNRLRALAFAVVLFASCGRVDEGGDARVYALCDVSGHPRSCGSGLINPFCAALDDGGADGGVGSGVGMCTMTCETICPFSEAGSHCLGVDLVAGAFDPASSTKLCFAGCDSECPGGLRCIEQDTGAGLLNLCVP